MKTRRWQSAGIALIIGLFAISAVSAGEDKGWYVGVGYGSSDDDILDESDNGFKVFGGYRFNKIVAVEAAYVDLGEFVGGSLEQSGLAAEAEFTWPIGKRFGLFAKAGFFAWEVDFDGFSDDGTDIAYGVGAKVLLGRKWAIRAEWEQFSDVSGGDVALLSAGVLFRF